MSTENIIFEFFDPNQVKDILKIKQTDDSDDALLRGTIGIKADRWVKTNLIPFVDTFPLIEEELEMAMAAACSFAASKYKRHNNNFESAKSFMEDAKEELKSLIMTLKARPTGRTDLVVVSSDYKSEPLRSRERFFD